MTAASDISDVAAADLSRQCGRPVKRLGPRVLESKPMAEMPLLKAPPGTDVNLVPSENRAKKLLIADMDSTMISVECIDELADYAGKKDAVSRITDRAMAGELDFEGALRERVALLAGVTEFDLAACLKERVKPNPGAAELVFAMNSLGAETVLVSGGFTAFAEPVGKMLGFKVIRANTLVFRDGVLTGEVGTPIVTSQTKLDLLLEVTRGLGCSTAEAIAVGDGANDAAMVREAGLGVAYRAKPALREVCNAAIDHSDLTALLALQGHRLPA